MNDDSAIEVIGAMKEAGLLRGAPSPSGSAAQIIGALSAAGLLRAGTGEAAAQGRPLAEPAPVAPGLEPKIDDEAYLGDVTGISISGGPGTWRVDLSSDTPARWKGVYAIDFPPNDKAYISEIDRIIAAPREGIVVEAGVKITQVYGPGSYTGRLQMLRAHFPLG